MQQQPDQNRALPRPHSPYFGSGPTKKRPHWSASALDSALVGQSHRSIAGISRIRDVIELTRSILHVPDDFLIAVVPGSATGAVETALWNLLGPKGIDVFAWDVFGKLWITDIIDQLQIKDHRIFEADFGNLPNLSTYSSDRDLVFTWNGTSSGVCIPNLDWIPENREGLTICDATSSIFAIPIHQWSKLDVTAFSWQKGLGGEAAHGMLIISPRAIERLKEYKPAWPIPRLMRLKHNGELLTGLFEGKTINTPSMLCVEDALLSLQWAQSVGGQEGLWQRCHGNFKIVQNWITKHEKLCFMAQDPATISPTSVCFLLRDSCAHRQDIYKNVATSLSLQGIAHDIKNHDLAPPSFRIWCGPTVESEDIRRLLPWIDATLNAEL